MNINQSYAVINAVNSQLWGEEAIQVTDLTGLVSLGNTVMSSNTSVDKYLGVLADRMAIFTMFDKRKIDTDRNNHDEYTNYCSKVAIRYANDLGESGIIFVIQDPTT